MVNSKLENLEPDYMLITGMQKSIMLGMLAYYQF